jgi:hypothetical protein
LSKTRRAYNKRPIIHGPGFQGWISSQKLKAEDLIDPLANDLLWPTWIGYHPYAAWGRMRGWRDWRIRSRRRQEWKREEARLKLYEGDTYCFLWNWGCEEVLEGLFGDFLAEKALLTVIYLYY